MKYLFGTTILLLFAAHLSFGQVAVRVFNYRPTGDFGFVMKPLNSVEVSWQSRFSKRPTKRWRSGYHFTYLNMKPRMEEIPTVTLRFDGNGTTMLPGAQSFQKYAIAQITGGSDFAIVHKTKFNFYVGADLLIGAASVDYTSVTPGFIDEGYSGGGILAGFRARIGVEYAFTDHISVFANTNKQGFLIEEPRALAGAYDLGLGLRYSFN